MTARRGHRWTLRADEGRPHIWWWTQREECSLCGAQTRVLFVDRPEYVEFSLDRGRTWSEQEPPCEGRKGK